MRYSVSGVVIEKAGRKTGVQRSGSAIPLYHIDHNAAPFSLFAALRVLLGHLSKRRRKSLFPLLILMLAGAVVELVTIGALLPFLAAIADPASPILAYFAPFLSIFGATERMQIIYVLTALFANVALIVAFLRLLLLWARSGFVHEIVHLRDARIQAA